MNRLTNVEHARFIRENIDIFRKNKVGQYAKFLDKTFVFQTYYHVNQVMTRVDTGTGGITDYLGTTSPVRYNKITEFPLGNIPDLRPELTTDETGTDLELEMSDIIILPNTIVPLPGDHVLIDIGGETQFLFRVDNIRYNTIQSGDFYMIDLHLKKTGKNIEIQFEHQIVETYTTIFDNIGTEDKCFIKSTDVERFNAIVKLFYKLRELYYSAFYNKECNSFLFDYGYTKDGDPQVLYDPYLEKFINKSLIFYDVGQDTTLMLSPNELLDKNFEYNFQRTLYYALLKESKDMLLPYIYVYTASIEKHHSPIRINGYNGVSTHLYLRNTPLDNEGGTEPVWFAVKRLPTCGPTWTLGPESAYFNVCFIKHIISGDIPIGLSYYEQIIFDFMNGLNNPISSSKMINNFDMDNAETFYYIPLILYILQTKYESYFKKDYDTETI